MARSDTTRVRRRAASPAVLLRTLKLSLALLVLAASPALADEGSVDLRNGGRIHGTIVELVPRDHVTVRLADGTLMIVPWTEVGFVFDGPRVFDGAGNQTSVDAVPVAPSGETSSGLAAPPSYGPPVTTPPPQTAPPQTMSPSNGALLLPPPSLYTPPLPTSPNGITRAPVYGTPVEASPEAYYRYSRLPKRGWSIVMMISGGLFLLQSAGTFVLAASDRDSDAAVGGAVFAGAGGLLLGFGMRRLRVRRNGLNELRNAGYLVSLRESLTFDAVITSERIVPRLSLRF